MLFFLERMLRTDFNVSNPIASAKFSEPAVFGYVFVCLFVHCLPNVHIERTNFASCIQIALSHSCLTGLSISSGILVQLYSHCPLLT